MSSRRAVAAAAIGPQEPTVVRIAPVEGALRDGEHWLQGILVNVRGKGLNAGRTGVHICVAAAELHCALDNVGMPVELVVDSGDGSVTEWLRAATLHCPGRWSASLQRIVIHMPARMRPNDVQYVAGMRACAAHCCPGCEIEVVRVVMS